MWSIYKWTADPLILWTTSRKPQEAVVLMQGFECFLPLTSIRYLQKERSTEKKKDFYEILESFLVGLTISIVISFINSLHTLLHFLTTAKYIPKYFNLLISYPPECFLNVIHVNEVVNVIKYFWRLFLEIKLGLSLSILETKFKTANTGYWRKYHLRNSYKLLVSDFYL